MSDYWFNTNYACGLVSTNKDGVVVETCPIYRWMNGKYLRDITRMLKMRGQYIEMIKLNIFLMED